jgi:hypothetical protein
VTRLRAAALKRGYVLVFVLGALALMAFVAGRFAARIDALRAQTATLQEHAQQALASGNALAAAVYAMTTTTLGPGGFGPHAEPLLYADGRPYTFAAGGEVRIQDQRGLLPLNAAERPLLARLLATHDVPVQEIDSWIDVLQDYLDADTLKRLNGAEAPEYAALGLPPPRNDWLVSARELAHLPAWRDRPAIASRIEALASTARQSVVNPNTAPMDVLAVVAPTATRDQIERFDAFRRRSPFFSGSIARAATGLALDTEGFVYFVGPQFRVTVSARGAARALQYNLTLTPNGRLAPWLISEVHPVHRPRSSEDTDRASPFPLALDAAPESRSPVPVVEPRRAAPEW